MNIEKIKNQPGGGSFPRIKKGYAIGERTYLRTGHDNVSFTSLQAKPLEKYLLEKMPWIARVMVKIHEGMGEVQNQLINAFGTGLVAPLFIMFNPLSDKDQDTKTYTAMRQPISAGLAVVTQAAIVVPFNAMIKHDADIGFLPMQYNRTLFPSDKYVEKLVKQENPGKKFQKTKDVDELKEAIEAYKKEHYEKPLIEMIKNDKIVFNTTDGKTTAKLEMPKKDFKNLFIETLDNIIAEERQEKLNATEIKMKKKISRGIFYHSNSKDAIDIMSHLEEKLASFYSQLGFESDSEAVKTVDSEAVKTAHKEFDKECNKVIRELKRGTSTHPEKEAVNSELIKIVKEIKRCHTETDEASLRILRDKIKKITDNIKIMSSMESTKDIINYVNDAIYRRTDAIDGTIKTLEEIKQKLQTDGITVKEAQEIIDRNIRESQKAVSMKTKAKGLKDFDYKTTPEWIDSVGARLSDKAQNIAKCIAKQAEKHATSYIDGLQRWTGLGVSLAILPVTCWLLNKIYPWFMDKAFPNLSKQNAKGNNNQAKKVEVA